MGVLVEFICESCGYKTRVSGGPDRGFFVSTQTVICRDCSEVVDILIGIFSEAPCDFKRRNRNRLGHCPTCNGANVFAWKEPWPCPKCGEKMVQGSVVLWWD